MQGKALVGYFEAVKLTDYFNSIFVINLDKRTDRWAECMAEFLTAKIPLSKVTRWSAYENAATPQSAGTHTHRDILRHVARERIPRALILEDDFCAITTKMLADVGHIPGRKVLDTHCSILNGDGNLSQRFEAMIPFLPDNYDFLYLGGGYAEPPVARYNRHVIQTGTLKGTHAYAVTAESAAKWTAWIDGRTNGDIDFNCGAADDMITSASHEGFKFYCLQPRLLSQRPSFSNLTMRHEDYLDSMTNPDHESLC